MWPRIIWLFILFLLGKHLCFPSSPRYLELADSADYYISKENWPRAEEKIVEALRLEPANFSNSLLLANLGLVQANEGELYKAISTLTMGLNMAPSSTVLLNNRAHTFLMVDSIDSAINDLDKSLRIDSTQEWTLQTRAYLYFQESNIPESKRLFEKLRKEFPNNQSAISGLAGIAEVTGDIQQAKDLYLQVIEKAPDDEETREAYILLLINANDYTGARAQIRKGLDMNSENGMLYLLRGYLHRLNFRLDEAQADKKIAISKGIDPAYAAGFIP